MQGAWVGIAPHPGWASRRAPGGGATRIFLFLSTPVALGVMIGAVLDNGPEVVVHHYFNGVYRPVGCVNATLTKS